MHPDGRIEEFAVNIDVNVPVSTAGTGKLNDVIDGANQTGTVLKISGLTDKIWPSDMFRIEGVRAVQPTTKQTTRYSTIFAAIHAAEPGSTELHVFPPIVTAGYIYQNVNKSPKHGAKITRAKISKRLAEYIISTNR